MSISVGPVGQGNSPSLNNNQDIEAQLIPAGRLLPFLVVTVLFFLWAIPNNLNDILIRQFMKSFNINRSSAAAVQIWFYLGYFLLAVPAGQLMRRFGYKMGIVTGLCLIGHWMPALLSGGAGGTVRVLSYGTVCHRQRPVVS